MLARLQQIHNVQSVRDFVNTTLCNHNQLQVGAFHMTEKTLVRGNKPCGMYFCLHGPRATLFTAIWEIEQNRVLFYGSRGERILKTDLTDSTQLESAAA